MSAVFSRLQCQATLTDWDHAWRQPDAEKWILREAFTASPDSSCLCQGEVHSPSILTVQRQSLWQHSTKNQFLSHRELTDPCDKLWVLGVFSCDNMQLEITALHSHRIGANIQSRLSCFPTRPLFLTSFVQRKKVTKSPEAFLRLLRPLPAYTKKAKRNILSWQPAAMHLRQGSSAKSLLLASLKWHWDSLTSPFFVLREQRS